VRARALVFALSLAPLAHAQPFAAATDASATAATSASAAPADAAPPKPSWPSLPEPTATTSSSSAPKPDPGPGMRESGGRRRGNPASGALFAILVVAIIVYTVGGYIKKKMR